MAGFECCAAHVDSAVNIDLKLSAVLRHNNLASGQMRQQNASKLALEFTC